MATGLVLYEFGNQAYTDGAWFGWGEEFDGGPIKDVNPEATWDDINEVIGVPASGSSGDAQLDLVIADLGSAFSAEYDLGLDFSGPAGRFNVNVYGGMTNVVLAHDVAGYGDGGPCTGTMTSDEGVLTLEFSFPDGGSNPGPYFMRVTWAPVVTCVPVGPFPHTGFASIGGHLVPPLADCPVVEEFPARTSDQEAWASDTTTPRDFAKRVPIGRRADQFTITVESIGRDPLTISAIEWSGMYHNSRRRI